MTEVDNDAPTAAGWDDLGFDPEALRERYRQERTKRLRPEGVNQYVEVKGDFSKYLDAPYPDLDPHFTRAAVDEEVDVFVGGGSSVLHRQMGKPRVTCRPPLRSY